MQSTSKCYPDRAGNKSAFKMKTDAMFRSVKRHCHERVKIESSKDQINILLNSKERDGEYFSNNTRMRARTVSIYNFCSLLFCSLLDKECWPWAQKALILIKPFKDLILPCSETDKGVPMQHRVSQWSE